MNEMHHEISVYQKAAQTDLLSSTHNDVCSAVNLRTNLSRCEQQLSVRLLKWQRFLQRHVSVLKTRHWKIITLETVLTYFSWYSVNTSLKSEQTVKQNTKRTTCCGPGLLWATRTSENTSRKNHSATADIKNGKWADAFMVFWCIENKLLRFFFM